jgi:hypothetical protein
MDIGTTPMGFDVVDVVGGLSYSNDLGPLAIPLMPIVAQFPAPCWRLPGSMTPTPDTWGGVRATGGGVSMSYDKGRRTASGQA